MLNKEQRRQGRLSAEIWRFYLVVNSASILLMVAVLFVTDGILLWETRLTEAIGRLFLGVLILILNGFFSRRVVMQIFGPLHALSEGTKEIERGNFGVRVENRDPHSELGLLITDFNHMARELSNVEMFRNDFINNFSHEFKTPIASISGFAQRLQQEDLPPEKQREYIDIIARESGRLAALSANILLLSKYEHLSIVPDQEPFSLDEQLRLCLLAQENAWMEKNLQLDIDLKPVTVLGNEDMLAQVWDNLISNAVKFSRENGRLRIACSREEDMALVHIEDSGIGMDEVTLRHAFDKFYQGDPSHTRAGNGLGLSVVKRILELSGGSISLFSRPGHGTTVTVKLPFISAK